MWDQLASAWNVVGEAAASATESLLEGAGAVADEAGRMAQATKLHAEIGLAQHSIDSIKRTWGYEAFDAMVAGDTEAVERVLRRCKTEIDGLQLDIDMKKRQIAELEIEEDPEDAVVMPPDAAPAPSSAPAAHQPQRLPATNSQQQQQALIAESMAAPVATIVQPEPASEQADDGFQDVGLSSPPDPRPQDASTAGAPAEAEAPAAASEAPAGASEAPAGASEARGEEPDELDAALAEADEALDLGPPPGDAPPTPAGAPEESADDQFDELMKAEK